MSQFDSVSILQQAFGVDCSAVDSGVSLPCQVVEEVATCRRSFDLGMPPGDRRVAENSDLGVFVESQPAARPRQQINAPFLPTALHLNPCSSQYLLNKCQAEPKAGAQEHDAHGLAQVGAIRERAAQPLEEEAAGK